MVRRGRGRHEPLTGKRRQLRETATTLRGGQAPPDQTAAAGRRGPAAEVRHHRPAGPRSGSTSPSSGTPLASGYDDLIRLYVLPTFDDMQAGKVDAELLERFYARLHKCRNMCTGRSHGSHECRPLSTSTTRKIHYIIRGALERAVRWRHLGVNKAAMAEAPSLRRTEPEPPSADEAAALLSIAWTDPEWGLLLWLTMITGSRRGEISALRWRHVDFDRAILWVHRSNAQTKAGVREKETKTGQRRAAHQAPGALGAALRETRRHARQ